jgi:hypothetical protein
MEEQGVLLATTSVEKVESPARGEGGSRVGGGLMREGVAGGAYRVKQGEGEKAPLAARVGNQRVDGVNVAERAVAEAKVAVGKAVDVGTTIGVAAALRVATAVGVGRSVATGTSVALVRKAVVARKEVEVGTAMGVVAAMRVATAVGAGRPMGVGPSVSRSGPVVLRSNARTRAGQGGMWAWDMWNILLAIWIAIWGWTMLWIESRGGVVAAISPRNSNERRRKQLM